MWFVMVSITGLWNYSTGWADAPFWADTSCCCASGAICYELGLVCKDYQRVEEDIGKETVK